MSNHSSVIIRKASGETQHFNINKLKNSLRRAGASEETVNEIASDIAHWITDGVTTKKIYERAFKLYRSISRSTGYRYRLKEALFEFGPSGYPFEQFIGEIFRRDGYEVSVAQVLEGRCVTHEMDVIATKNGTQHLMECKYTHDRGNHLGIQVPLYVRSRVEDIIDKREKLAEYKDTSFTTWVVTNARFSSDSENYSKCRNINLLGWDYPLGNSLKDMIERLNIFPLTILRNLTRDQKQQLLNKNIVTCRQLSDNQELLTPFNLTGNRLRLLLSELDEIIG